MNEDVDTGTDSREDRKDHCQFYVQRKQRFCRLLVMKGQKFCVEHSVNMRSDNQDSAKTSKRIPCPYDPKHSCFENKLQKHLAICNARPQERLYIQPGINSGDAKTTEQKSLADIDEEKLQSIIDKINYVFDEVIPKIEENILNHPLVSEELQKSECGTSSKKHLLQNSSLMGILADAGLLQDNTCFVELGAGRGLLGYWIGKAVENCKKCLLVLVDRASQRNKFDNRLKDATSPSVVRIRADIADLCIGKIKEIHEYQHVVAFSKHLCGTATDLALRCLTASDPETGAGSLSVAGILMALCCHHRCDWSSYVGKEFLIARGFTQGDFSIMRGITSWAVCGWHLTPQVQGMRSTCSQDRKREIGFKCKVVLDYGRLSYLKNRNFDCSLLRYVRESVTPETLCLFAKGVNSTKL